MGPSPRHTPTTSPALTATPSPATLSPLRHGNHEDLLQPKTPTSPSTESEPATVRHTPTQTELAAAKQLSEEMTAVRRAKLQKVFDMFDLSGGGNLEKTELLKLGQRRRQLGQITGVWTEEQNQKLMARIDTDGDGKLSVDEFCVYFGETLTKDPVEFDAMIEQFTEVANDCRCAHALEEAARLDAENRSAEDAMRVAEAVAMAAQTSGNAGTVAAAEKLQADAEAKAHDAALAVASAKAKQDGMARSVAEKRDGEAALLTLGDLFERIDHLVDQDGCASKEELKLIFTVHADEFLAFCEHTSSTYLSKQDFVSGIMKHTEALSAAEFEQQWLDRMEACVSAAQAKAHGITVDSSSPAKRASNPLLVRDNRHAFNGNQLATAQNTTRTSSASRDSIPPVVIVPDQCKCGACIIS